MRYSWPDRDKGRRKPTVDQRQAVNLVEINERQLTLLWPLRGSYSIYVRVHSELLEIADLVVSKERQLTWQR
jgi:hypothetical protein